MIASLPKIAVNVAPTTAGSAGPATSEAAPTGKFSDVLAQATHTSAAPAKPPSEQENQPREDGHSSPGQSHSNSHASSRGSETTTQRSSAERSEKPNADTPVHSTHTATAEASQPVAPQPSEVAENSAVAAVPTTPTSSDFSSSTIFAPGSAGTADFSFAHASPFISTLTTAAAFSANSLASSNFSDVQQQGSSSTERPTSTAVEGTVISNDAVGSPDAMVTDDTVGLNSSSNVAAPLPTPQSEPTLTSPTALPTSKSIIASSPNELPSINTISAKTASKTEAAGPAHDLVNGMPASDQKPETHIGGLTSHPIAHNSVSSSDSTSHSSGTTLHSIVSKETSALPPTPSVAAPSTPNAKFELTAQAQNSSQPAAKISETTAPIQNSVKPVAAANDAKPQSDSTANQDTASAANSQTTGVTAANVTPKAGDPFQSNIAQTTGIAANNKVDTGIVKNEPSLDKAGSRPPDPEMAVDKQAAAVAAYPGSLFQSAKLMERLGQSELRVGIQAGEFGNVDIRTSMARNQFTAEISVERGELGKVMAAELPSLQNRLSEQRLPAANIILQNQSSGGSAGFEQGSRQSQTMPQIAALHSSEEEALPVAAIATETNVPTSRLDVHM